MGIPIVPSAFHYVGFNQVTIIQAIKARDQESVHCLGLLVNNQDMQNVLIGWTMYRPRVKDRELEAGEDCFMVAESIWPKVNYEKLAGLAGVHWRAAQDMFHRLREARLVYPDGSIHKEAHTMLRAEVMMHIRTAR